jgi:uncharacterized protein YdaU (DUF1376 family)
MSVARPDTWMPMYWADYWKDTAHLGRADHGSYMHLIGHYWSSGKPLPDDDAKLARIARCTRQEWRYSRIVLAEFFDISEGQWNHKRIDAELEKARKRYEKRFDARANFKRKLPPKLGTGLAAQPQPQSTIVDENGVASLSSVPRRLTEEERDLAARFNHGNVPAETTDHDVAIWRERAKRKQAAKVVPLAPQPPPPPAEPKVDAPPPEPEQMPDLPAFLDRRTA